MRSKLRNYLLKKVFLALAEEDVVPWNNLPIGEKDVLIAEAKLIRDSRLWERLTVSSKIGAQKLMFEKSKTIDDMVFGKALLYTIDMLDKRLKTISKFK